MELISIIDDFTPKEDPRLLQKAAELAPVLRRGTAEPTGAFRLKERYSAEREPVTLSDIPQLRLSRGDNLCLDFGDHQVGRLTLRLDGAGSHPDAPAYIKLKFAENLRELWENTDTYDGWVSGSWIQEEYVHVDVLPAEVTLSRRYAFRYLKITVLNTSPKYQLLVKGASCETVSSADPGKLGEYRPKDPQMREVYRICLRTLHNCMQDVFEDGPKRDRRMWLGDLRLQALVNYASYRNLDLVRRSLYLFGGTRFPDGRVAACVFTEPVPAADDTCLFDYMLFYPVVLDEYLAEVSREASRVSGAAAEKAARDSAETLEDLYDIAQEQIDIALAHVDESGLVHGEELGTVFIDWADELHKEACAQAVLICAMGNARRLSERKGDTARMQMLTERQEELRAAARAAFWDEERQCFSVDGQCGMATQAWMVLAGVCSREEAAGIFERADEFSGECRMMTPYMHHYYIMALLSCGRKEQALGHIRWYWGSMVEAGADTCPETWVPGDPDTSPYGGAAVNSCCHAWSCTPAYLLPTFFGE